MSIYHPYKGDSVASVTLTLKADDFRRLIETMSLSRSTADIALGIVKAIGYQSLEEFFSRNERRWKSRE